MPNMNSTCSKELLSCKCNSCQATSLCVSVTSIEVIRHWQIDQTALHMDAQSVPVCSEEEGCLYGITPKEGQQSKPRAHSALEQDAVAGSLSLLGQHRGTAPNR